MKTENCISSGRKVCFIVHSLSFGGMERVVSRLLTCFAGKPGVELHLVLCGINRDISYAIPASVSIHRPDFVFSNNQRTWNTFRTILFLRKTIAEIKPDHIASFGEYWNNMVLLSLYGLPVKTVVSDRSSPVKSLGSFHDRLRCWLYPRAAGFIAQTERARELATARRLNRNVRVIGNPIRKVGNGTVTHRENIVLSVGRLIRTKHFDRLIQLFVQIGQPGWKLVIVGGDAQKQNLMQELQALINQLGAQDFVVLAGSQSDVDSYYRKSKIFAFTSSSEGFPNVVGEALSAGLPVVSYDCTAGPADMITDGENGFLVPVFDDQLFADRLRMLMLDSDLREQQAVNARNSVDIFSDDVICEKYYEFITSA